MNILSVEVDVNFCCWLKCLVLLKSCCIGKLCMFVCFVFHLGVLDEWLILLVRILMRLFLQGVRVFNI